MFALHHPTLVLATVLYTFQHMLILKNKFWVRLLIYHILIKEIIPAKLPKDLIFTMVTLKVLVALL